MPANRNEKNNFFLSRLNLIKENASNEQKKEKMEEQDKTYFKEDKSVFSVPEGYFDNFTENVNNMIAGEERKSKVVSLNRWRRILPLAVSSVAVVALIVSFALFYANDKSEVPANEPMIIEAEDEFDDFDFFEMNDMIAEAIYEY